MSLMFKDKRYSPVTTERNCGLDLYITDQTTSEQQEHIGLFAGTE